MKSLLASLAFAAFFVSAVHADIDRSAGPGLPSPGEACTKADVDASGVKYDVMECDVGECFTVNGTKRPIYTEAWDGGYCVKGDGATAGDACLEMEVFAYPTGADPANALNATPAALDVVTLAADLEFDCDLDGSLNSATLFDLATNLACTDTGCDGVPVVLKFCRRAGATCGGGSGYDGVPLRVWKVRGITNP